MRQFNGFAIKPDGGAGKASIGGSACVQNVLCLSQPGDARAAALDRRH